VGQLPPLCSSCMSSTAGRTVARAAAQRPGRGARTLLSDSEGEQAGGRADSGSDSGSEVVLQGHRAATAHTDAHRCTQMLRQH
jgi:hypothetical protein